jgi:hypothetical protein
MWSHPEQRRFSGGAKDLARIATVLVSRKISRLNGESAGGIGMTPRKNEPQTQPLPGLRTASYFILLLTLCDYRFAGMKSKGTGYSS